MSGLRLEELAVASGPPLDDADLPPAAVVIPHLEGWEGLRACLEALLSSRYPADRLTVVVVDNGSRDRSPAHVRAAFPGVTVLEQGTNTGFCAAANAGAAVAARGGAKVLAFLNDDTLVERDWLRELVAPVARGECACTGARMLSWDGRHLDHAGGGSNFQGIAVAVGYRRAAGPEHDVARRALFACGGAMAIDAEVFRDSGGFDEAFFAYYDDLDLGWRLWLLGHEVHYAPRAVCRHQHSRTSGRFPPETVRLLVVRNALLTCVKNYDDDSLRRVLPALLALAQRRAWVLAGVPDDGPFRIERARGRPGWLGRVARRLRPSTWRLGRLGAADLIALNDVLGDWDGWMRRRAEVQRRRVRSDAEIRRLFLHPLWCVEGEAGYVELQRGLETWCGLHELFAGSTLEGPDPEK